MTTLTIEVAIPEELSQVRHAIDNHLEARSVEPELRRDIVLCASEATANALVHSGSVPSRPVTVDVQVGLTIVVVVTDYGRWKQESPGHVGRGLQIVQSLATTFAISAVEAGTTVTFTFNREPIPR